MKIRLFVIGLGLLFTLTGCGETIIPLENPEPQLFSEFYEGENFTILDRTIIESNAYVSLGYGLDDGYMLGAYHISNYRVLYDEEYYNLQQGHQLGLYKAEDLIEYGITGISRSCSYDDSCG